MTKYMKFYWKENLLLFFIIVVGALSQVLSVVLNARAFNALIAFDWTEFVKTMLLILFMLIIYILSLLIKIPYETRVSQLMSTKIRTDVISKLEDVSYQKYHEYDSGTFVSWITNDINTIERDGFANVYLLITMIVNMLFASIALLFFHWSIIVYSVAVSVITILLPRLVQAKVRDAVIDFSKQQERFVSVMTSMIKGFDTLFSFNLVSRITKTVTEASEELADKRVKQQRAMAYSAILGASGNLFGQAGVLVLTGYLAFKRIVSLGSITATGALSETIFNSLGNITNVIVEIKTVQPIFEKFDALDADDAGDYLPFHKTNDQISLDNLNYSFGDNQLWTNVSYSFNEGGKYAIVGESGTGKTTLLNILNGKINDYQGSAKFSNNELKDVDGYQLRQEIIYLDQAPYIFDGSIFDNLTLGESFSEQEIWEALDVAGLKQFVQAQENQLESPVGEDGRLLSGGQKQRLSLARGFLRGKRVILIDEGTSSLDHETALEIENKLVENADLTVIMVTHNLREEIASKLDGILNLNDFKA
ncbi:ATP-binding cassette domain-containing protein [Granulicatella seriolae]|uniref:ABC transporter ATP-binding protein/permease n=1 Tax=Granulicatella seriolae TaxID=2967226 RepID=A0ABT1WQL0_9LACT|nr:ABC transporter ATP-binding protein [Granulicatella seriolae]